MRQRPPSMVGQLHSIPVANMNSGMSYEPSACRVPHWPGVQASHGRAVDEVSQDDARRTSPAKTNGKEAGPCDLTSKGQRMHPAQLGQHDQSGKDNGNQGEDESLNGGRQSVEGRPEEVGVEDCPDGADRYVKEETGGPPDYGRCVPSDHGAEKADQISQWKTCKDQCAYTEVPGHCSDDTGQDRLSKRNSSYHECVGLGVLSLPTQGQHHFPVLLPYPISMNRLTCRTGSDATAAAIELG